MTIKSNVQWDELCALTTTLFPQYGSRPAAFKAAVLQRPDLANVAIGPTGEPVAKGSKVGQAVMPVSEPQAATAESVLGEAKPWSEVLHSLGVQTVTSTENPAATQGGALPWVEVFRQIKAEGHRC